MIPPSRRKVGFTLVFLFTLCFLGEVSGLPSGGRYPPTFTYRDGDWFDSWGFNRNYYGGDDGYMPNVAYESLGTNREAAYELGDGFKETYSDRVQRAASILRYVQRWTDYGYDEDNVVMDGYPQREWAWNADEMTSMFDTATNAIAVGDCEDMAFLCATLYVGAGFDVALVLTSDHVALLIWLPEYPNANYYWDIPDDGRREGWIWVEATGEQNPLGWTPPDFRSGFWTAYPLGLIIANVDFAPKSPSAEDDVVVQASVSSVETTELQVSLIYSTTREGRNDAPMVLKESSYEAVIPKQPEGTTVEFYVSASDNRENARETERVTYTVGGGFEIPDFLLDESLIYLVLGLLFLVLLIKALS